MPCDSCARGPREFRGHSTLGVLLPEKQPAEGMAFACFECGTYWVRHHDGQGGFTWVRMRPPR